MKKEINRRDFVKYSGLLSAGALMLPSFILKKTAGIGLQLYTVRDLMQTDPEGTLRKIADIGYEKLESAGYSEGLFYNMEPAAFKATVEKLGMKLPSSHYMSGISYPNQVGTLTNGWEKVVEDAKTVGIEYMVLAYLPEQERRNLNDYKKVISLLNKAGEVCKKQGIQLAYHNHDFEFKTIEGKIPYEMILQETDPDLLVMELDLYWTVKAGFDPVKLFEENPGRYPLWHVKDMDANGNFSEVGTGVIDFRNIFDNKKKAGLKHFFVEQDQTVRPPLESIQISYKNAKKLV